MRDLQGEDMRKNAVDKVSDKAPFLCGEFEILPRKQEKAFGKE